MGLRDALDAATTIHTVKFAKSVMSQTILSLDVVSTITPHDVLQIYRILLKISPLPSLTLKFLHRYVCLDYKPPSHQVDCTRTRARERVRTYVTPPFN